MTELMSRKVVLVVDDDPTLPLLLKGMIPSERYAIESGADGQECLERLRSLPPIDVVLLDVQLREENGLALLPKILEQAPNLPVVMMTVDGSVRTVVEAMRKGASDYLVKPVVGDQIVERLDELFAERANKSDPPPPSSSSNPFPRSARSELERQERDLIVRALSECQGNASAAMRLLGMPRTTFYRRLKQYDIS
jgi:DNA-binding NtrC family response regulator